MMMGLHFKGEVPFRTVYIHGLVRDEHGQKMSKAKGNVVDPLELIERYGCDALRFTLTALSAPAGRDVKLAESRIEGYRNFGTKLWNATRYALMNGAAPDPKFDPAKCRQPINRWIVGKLAETGRELDGAFRAYRFNDVADTLYHFTWGQFCDWYIEFTKPILDGEDEAAAAETRAAMAWVLGRLLHLLHPIMPFITEELWAHVGAGQGGALITAPWPGFDAALIDPEAEAEIDWAIRLIGEVRAVRAEMHVPPAAKVQLLIKDAGPATLARLEASREIVDRLARLNGIQIADGEVPKGAAQIVIDEATVFLPLAGVIDLAQEKARLAREIQKLEADIGKLDKKLANEQFLAKAPEEVVEEQRERRADLAEKRERLGAALARLGD